MGHIAFLAREVPNAFGDRKRLRAWLERVAAEHGSRIDELNFVLLSDAALHGFNQRYLKHHDLTDVITFDLQAGSGIAGDVLISLDRVRENALHYSVPITHELRRVMVHGLLHLLGHHDKKKDERAAMSALEDAYLKVY